MTKVRGTRLAKKHQSARPESTRQTTGARNPARGEHPLRDKLGELGREDPPKYEDATKTVRDRMRHFNAMSIIDMAVDYIHRTASSTSMVVLERRPWIGLLLIKLVLEDEKISLFIGPNCTPDAFDRSQNDLWRAQAGDINREDGTAGVYRLLRAVIRTQLPFQQRINYDFLRWPALFERLPAEHPSRIQFGQRFGMSPEVFAEVCYAVFVHVLNGDLAFRSDSLDPLRKRHGEQVDRFLGEFTRDVLSLRVLLIQRRKKRIETGLPVRPPNELHEFPWLARYPMLWTSKDTVMFWHPILIARGLESAVHQRMSELGAEYSQLFSKVFESHVLEVFKEALPTAVMPQLIGEAIYKDRVGADKHAMEAIYTRDGVNVLVEARMTVYSEDVISSYSGQVIWKGLKRVWSAMNKAWEVSSRIRKGDLTDWPCSAAGQDFVLIVTSQPIACPSGEHFKDMFRRDIFDPARVASMGRGVPTVQQLERLPLCNVVIASIEEYERLMCGVRDGGVDLIEFVKDAASANSDKKTSVMYLHQLMNSKKIRYGLTKVVDQARRRAEAALMDALKGAAT